MMCDYGPKPFLFNIRDKAPFAFGARIEMNAHKFLHHFLAIVKCSAVFSLIYNIFLFYPAIVAQGFFAGFLIVLCLPHPCLANLVAVLFVDGTC